MTAGKRIAESASILGPDELEVLAVVAERLAEGRRQDGELRLATDRRAFHAEAAEELLDAVVYLAADVVRARIRREETPR